MESFPPETATPIVSPCENIRNRRMAASNLSLKTETSTGPFIVSLDIGTSSVRTMLFDAKGKAVDGFGKQISYEIETTSDGGVEINPLLLLDISQKCLHEIRKQLKEKSVEAVAVAGSGFWHSFLGLGEDGEPTTPVMHLLDTRAQSHADWLKEKLDQKKVQSRVGCVFHPSYWPARLLWLAENSPEVCQKTKEWVSFGDYLYRKITGKSAESTSMVSGSGLWDQNRNDYDEELLSILPIRREQLAKPDEMDQPVEFEGLKWFPVIGDGAANNIGAGCITRDRFALMVGTTGAMRAVAEQPSIEIPWGAWCYRIDRRRFVIGGVLSDGGKVFEWMNKRLADLPAGDDLEKKLSAMTPGAHGLTVLPLFAGERSPNWNGSARAAITGLSLHTEPIDILRASLEAVALRFRLIFDILRDRVGEPEEVLATGEALRHSPAWTQMMADALGRPILSCLEEQTSSRGAALLALERLGILSLSESTAEIGKTFQPDPEHREAYAEMLKDQQTLYGKLYSS